MDKRVDTPAAGPVDKRTKRRDNILYRLRRRGVRCSTRGRTIYVPAGTDTAPIPQVRRLCAEFGFAVQTEIL